MSKGSKFRARPSRSFNFSNNKTIYNKPRLPQVDAIGVKNHPEPDSENNQNKPDRSASKENPFVAANHQFQSENTAAFPFSQLIRLQ